MPQTNNSKLKSPFTIALLSVMLSIFACHIGHAQIITTIAGTGVGDYNGDTSAATATSLFNPIDICLDDSGNIYVADGSNYRIRKISPAGTVTTIAGIGVPGYSGDNGPATAAGFINATGITRDRAGNMYIVDFLNRRIRKIDTAGIITTFAGNGTSGFSGDGGPATNAQLYRPFGVTTDKYGNVFISDNENNRIRKVDTSGIITTIAGTGSIIRSGDGGPATAAGIYAPTGLTTDTSGNLYFSEYAVIRKVDAAGIITTFAGIGYLGYTGDGGPATAAQLSCQGVMADKKGNIYFADISNHAIRKINTSGTITTVAGNGTQGYNGDSIAATGAQLNFPSAVTVDAGGNLYIADNHNHRLRKVDRKVVGVSNVDKQQFTVSIFPNPSSGSIIITTTAQKQEAITITIRNIAGQQVKQIAGTTNQKIPLHLYLPSGIYTATVNTPDHFAMQQFIIR